MSRILFVTHSAAPAGAELSLLRLAASMKRAKASVLFTAQGGLVDRFREQGIDVGVIELPSGRKRITRGTKDVRVIVSALYHLVNVGWTVGRYVQEKRPEVLVARSTKALVIGFIASRRAGIPLVWSVHDRISPQYFGRLSAYSIRVFGRLAAQGYIVNSESTLSTIWPGKKPATVIPPGLYLDESPWARTISGEIGVVAIVGRLAPWKGQHIFIRAFAAAFGDKPQVQAFIIGGALFGEADYEVELRSLAVELGVADRVHFTGHVDDIARRLRGVDILVHASVIPEPFGSVVIEGMHAGCAVIATMPGGPAEIINDEVDGLLVECGNVNALSEAMVSLADNPNQRKAFASAGFDRAKDFDIKILASRTEEWLEQF